MSSLDSSPPLDSALACGCVPHPGTSDTENDRWGRCFVWLTPIFAGISCVPNLELGGARYTGWLWMILLAIAVGLYATRQTAGAAASVAVPGRMWLVWAAYLWCSLIWCDPWGRMNIQQACQITMPLMISAVSAHYIRSESDLKNLLKYFYLALLPLGLTILLTRLESSDVTGMRDAAMTVALVGCVFLAGIRRRPIPAYVGWVACIVLAAFSLSRMAAIALLLAIVFHPLYRGLGRRALAVAALAGLGLALFYSPAFQERTFYSGSGTLTDLIQGDGVDTSGRNVAWPDIWEEAWKRPIFGAGVGSSAAFVETVWPGVTHPHNDYLRIGFELGLTGLAIFVLAIIWQLNDLVRMARESSGLLQQTSAACVLGIVFFLLVATTDNPLVYNLWYTDPLFALIGGAYGAAAACSPEASPT